MYAISSGEDGVLLLEQATNAKQSKEMIFFIGFLTSGGILELVYLIQNCFAICFEYMLFSMLALEIKKCGRELFTKLLCLYGADQSAVSFSGAV